MKKSWLILALVTLGVNLFAGLEWKFKVENVARQKKQSYQMIQHYFAQKGDLRMEIIESNRKDEIYDQNIFWIFRSRENELYIINKKEKSYYQLPLDMMLRTLGAFGSLVKIEISDIEHKVEKLPDEEVAGLKCQHFRVNMEYKMKMKIVLIKKTMQIRSEREIWSTKAIAFQEIADSFRFKGLKTGFKELDELIEKEKELYENIGIIVKSVEKSYDVDKKGVATENSVLTSELLEVKKSNFSEELFEIPAGYKETPLPGVFKEE